MTSPDDSLFEQLLSRLEPDLSDTHKRYKQLRLKLVKYFAWKTCEDPELHADEAITRLLKSVTDGRQILADNLYSYVYGIARNVLKEHLRAKKRNEELLDNWEPQQSEDEALLDCRTICLSQLSFDKHHLLFEYYSKKADRELMAARLGISINALRLQIFRLRTELKTCYENCLRKLAAERN